MRRAVLAGLTCLILGSVAPRSTQAQAPVATTTVTTPVPIPPPVLSDGVTAGVGVEVIADPEDLVPAGGFVGLLGGVTKNK